MKSKKGIALFSVMVMTGLLMLLLGAFMQVNQQQFGLVNNDQSHLAASEAARSAMDYCTYRLEHHRQWGSSPFEGRVDSGTAGLLEVREVRNSHRLEGRVVQSDTNFEVTLLNNIDGTAQRDGVPVGFCRLRINAWRGTALVRREAMLGTAPLFDAAVISSRRINVDSQTLTVASTDPLRNRLRSKGDIMVPTYEGQFNFSAPADATERGVLWAREGISMGSHDLTDEDEAARAVRATGGRFMPEADTHYEVYDLQIDEVRAPETSVTIQPGVYIFNRQTVTYESDDGPRSVVVPVLQRRDWAVNDEGYVEGGDLREAWYLTSSLPADADSDWITLYNDLPEEGLHPMTSNTFSLDAGVQVHFNSLDPRFDGVDPPSLVLNSDVNLHVNGDFGVASWDADYHPTLIFRDPETGEVGVDSAGRTVSGSITTRSTGDRPGSIMIEGAILGNGKLLADGDVTLKNTFAAVSTDEASDLSIFAGGSVNIRPRRAAWRDEETVFEGGLEDRDASTAFRGLIYARQDVIIDAADSGAGTADVYVEGAVVAREGKVKVTNARNVAFKYNPDYLDTILTPRIGDRVRLERAVWKEL